MRRFLFFTMTLSKIICTTGDRAFLFTDNPHPVIFLVWCSSRVLNLEAHIFRSHKSSSVIRCRYISFFTFIAFFVCFVFIIRIIGLFIYRAIVGLLVNSVCTIAVISVSKIFTILICYFK